MGHRPSRHMLGTVRFAGAPVRLPSSRLTSRFYHTPEHRTMRPCLRMVQAVRGTAGAGLVRVVADFRCGGGRGGFDGVVVFLQGCGHRPLMLEAGHGDQQPLPEGQETHSVACQLRTSRLRSALGGGRWIPRSGWGCFPLVLRQGAGQHLILHFCGWCAHSDLGCSAGNGEHCPNRFAKNALSLHIVYLLRPTCHHPWGHRYG